MLKDNVYFNAMLKKSINDMSKGEADAVSLWYDSAIRCESDVLIYRRGLKHYEMDDDFFATLWMAGINKLIYGQTSTAAFYDFVSLQEHGWEITGLQDIDNNKYVVFERKEIQSISWNMIVSSMFSNDSHDDRFEVNTDNEILCKTENDANCIADFIEALGFDTIHVSENEDVTDGFKYEVYPD